ncbi:hypothetical protein [Natrinema sp. CBA1119]|nr:hypothetical protein [Natrinema sp. CBA1119]
MALFAGQSGGLTDDVRPVGALLEEFVAETIETVSGLPAVRHG